MNIEQKAKAYDEAIEKFKPIYDLAKKENRTIDIEEFEDIFPELKESEDERIRKAIIEGLKEMKNSFHTISSIKIDDAIAWLEKQGKHNPYSGISFNYNGHTWGMCARDNGVDILLDKQLLKHLEEQGEQKSTDTCDSLNIKGKEFPASEKRDFGYFSKPDDKVEPKFKVGDWVFIEQIDNIINGPCKIKEVNDYGYVLDGIREMTLPFTSEHCMRLWTIQDAKDGDVLACDINKAEIGGDIEKLPNITPTICLYQNVVKDKDYIHTYCFLYNGSSLVLSNSMYYNTFVYNIHPATKEQRDLLFQKMKETGYEWDAEKKELRKIIDEKQIKKNLQDNSFRRMFEHNPAWSEEDKKMFVNIKACLRNANKDYSREVDWLKSMRPQNTWKPSDYQLEALESATENCAYSEYQDCLRELIGQLKKLRER